MDKTIEELYEHAAAIWGRSRIVVVNHFTDRVEVHLRVPGVGDGVLVSDTRERWLSVHALDAAGNITCHDDCKRLAAG